MYDKNNVPRAVGVGLFARVFKETFPLVLVEEEGWLHDMALRENFVESVFVYRRWRTVAEHFSADKLVSSHREHKMLRGHTAKNITVNSDVS